MRLTVFFIGLLLLLGQTGIGTCDTLSDHIADPNAHHSKNHNTAHYENGVDELFIEYLGTACASGKIPKSDGNGGIDCSDDNGDASLSYVTVNSESGLSGEYVLGTAVIMRGAYGSLPAASKSGLLYSATDDVAGGLQLYRDNGSSWNVVYTNAAWVQTTGGLTCGAGKAGEIGASTIQLQFCDNAGTPVLKYVPWTSVSGNFTQGSMLFGGTSSTGVAQDNSNIFWDDAANRLGVGTTSPSGKLELSDTNANTRLYITALGTGQYSMVEFMDEGGTSLTGQWRYDHNNDRFEGIVNGGTANFKLNSSGLTAGTGAQQGSILEAVQSSAATTVDLRVQNLSTAASANGTRILMGADGENNTGDVFLRMIVKNGGASEKNWVVGADTSDSASFKISTGSTLGTNTFVVNPNDIGVGFGTSTITRPVTVAGAINIVPQASPPASAASGDIYVDSDGTDTLCFYNGAAWVNLSGGTGCS